MPQSTTVQSLMGTLHVNFEQERGTMARTITVRLTFGDKQQLLLLPADDCSFESVSIKRYTNGWGSSVTIEATGASVEELRNFFLVTGCRMIPLVREMIDNECYMYWKHETDRSVELTFGDIDGISRFLAVATA